MARRGWSTCVIAAAALAFPAGADAGTVSSDPYSGELRFEAFAGERIDVTFDLEHDWLCTDVGAPLVAGDNCALTEGGARCLDYASALVRLGDRDDHANVDALGFADVRGDDGDDNLRVGSY